MKVGHICDRCNRDVRNGAPVRFYATCYDGDGWVLRRFYCDDCGEDSVSPGTIDTDELVGEAVWFNHMLAAVRIKDRSPPTDGNQP